MQVKYGRLCLAAILALGASANAYADGFDVRHFTPIAGSEGVFSVESTRTMPHTGFDVKVLADYANTPLRYTTSEGAEAKMDHLVTMTVSGAIGLLDFLEVGVSVPVVPYEHYNDNFGADEGISRDRGYIGDTQIRVKGTILQREDFSGFGLGAGVILSVPTGKKSAYLGAPTVTGRPYIAADYEIGPVEMMLNAGFTFRKKAEFLDYVLEHGFNYGFGVNVHAVEDWLDVKGEIFGETPLSDRATKDHQNSAEFLGGIKFMTPIGLNFTAGAGTGIGDGIRNPKYRVLFGAEFQSDNGPDTDGDGIKDRKDACPTLYGTDEFEGCPDPDPDSDSWCDPWVESDELAELFHCQRTDICPDIKGIEAFSGCPVPDTDLDGWCDDWVQDPYVADSLGCKMMDVCPSLAGVDEANGCPVPDSDQDGWCDSWMTDLALADHFQCKITDKCPDIAGIDEFSGCPNPDPDGDGICSLFVDQFGLYDAFFCTGIDKCAEQAEDFDDFEDEDGCPDPDNDHDGICDPWISEQGLTESYAQICRSTDICPLEPETINGYKDDDGCPDKGKQLVFVTDEKIEIRDKIYFDNNKATIKKKSNSLLDQIAATILAHPEIKHITVEGHTDDTGKYEHNIMLSRQRAQSVVNYLTGKGLDPKKFTAIGFGPDRPIDPAKTSKARANNRRVEFIITERSQD